MPGVAVYVGILTVCAKSLAAVNGLRLYVFRSRGRVTVCVGKADGRAGCVFNGYAIACADVVAVCVWGGNG